METSLFCSNQSSSLLKCVVEENLSFKELIPLSNILDDNCLNICPALLQFESQKHLQSLKFLQENGKPEDFNNLRKKICKFFDNFKEQIIETINLRQEKEMIKIDIVEQQFIKAFQFCKDVTQKEDIEKILKSYHNEQNRLDEELREIFLKRKPTISSELQKLIKDLESLKYLDFSPSERAQKAVVDLLVGFQFLKMNNQGDFIEFELVKSTIEQTASAVVSKNSSGYQVIKNPMTGRIVLYTHFILNSQEKYVLLINVTNSKSGYRGFQLIGLVDDITKDSKPLHQVALAFCNCIIEYGCTKKIKGEKFMTNLLQKDRFQVEISICLEDRTFVACDYPERNSVYSIPQENIISGNSYRLGIEMYQRDKIEILSFKEVSCFSEF